MGDKFKWLGMSEDGQTVTIKRYEGPLPTPAYATSEWMAANADLVGRAAALDIESTGLNSQSDNVIEVAVRGFQFHRTTGEILAVDEPYCEFQEQSQALSSRIKFITGINDTDLKGRQIQWSRVEGILAKAEVVIAHNAGFDRAFIDRKVPCSPKKVWACTLKQIDWESKGYLSQRLENLCIYHGFFSNAHRALADIDALIYLLSMKPANSNETYLFELVKNSARPIALISAKNSPFETKDLLKDRRYQWNAEARCWQKQVYRDELDNEVAWMETQIYKGRFGGSVSELPITESFRSR